MDDADGYTGLSVEGPGFFFTNFARARLVRRFATGGTVLLAEGTIRGGGGALLEDDDVGMVLLAEGTIRGGGGALLEDDEVGFYIFPYRS